MKKFTQPVRRKMIQLAAFIFCNLHFENFLSGKIYTGDLKKFCSPGLNCYSCPAANFSCPIGALQAVSTTKNFQFSFYATGFLFLVGLILGRAVCGFLCPFGLFQEILHKLPTKKFELPKILIYIKYFVLIISVLLLPEVLKNFAGTGQPTFCEYICPAGTLEAGLPLIFTHEEFIQTLGKIFAWKFFLLLIIILCSIFINRFFCKMLCPLGAIYGLFNKISFYRLQFDSSSCINCGTCKKFCPMNLNPAKNQNSPECILCGKCADVCPKNSIFFGGKYER